MPSHTYAFVLNCWNSDGYKNCAPLVFDLFFIYIRDFMDSLNHNNQAGVKEAFNSTSGYLDDLLNIDNPLKAWSIKFIHLNYIVE